MRAEQADFHYNRFLPSVREHKMTIRQDDGLYRHITFRNPRSSNLMFHLTTWPGYLAISGDGPDFMFTRLKDMFEFFRDSFEGNRGTIDYRYWAEKAVAHDRGGIRQFEPDQYVKAIRRDAASFISMMPLAEAKRVVQEMHDEDLFAPGDSEHDSMEKAMSYRCPVTDDAPFQDFFDHSLTAPSHTLKWACHAIQWGIKQYDLYHAGNTQDQHDEKVRRGVL